MSVSGIGFARGSALCVMERDTPPPPTRQRLMPLSLPHHRAVAPELPAIGVRGIPEFARGISRIVLARCRNGSARHRAGRCGGLQPAPPSTAGGCDVLRERLAWEGAYALLAS